MKRYGYHRTSTREQRLDRGIAEITAYCEQNQLELEKIFTDQQTGKNFNRPRYQVLKEDVLRSGDELIITEVDRLEDNLADLIKKVDYKEKPECISADGLNLMDDVGGIHGYVRFLETIHGFDLDERDDMREWARGMGWTGRMRKPERIL